ncbi:hypothetical protein KSP40_PGU010940 [Platanthera guangdongensis]|uniref:Uncharacterized protein n=1 Tax=Platanthera guangdongensis TaxID=2320717 RepID=A0ABR2N386_9ASPA
MVEELSVLEEQAVVRKSSPEMQFIEIRGEAARVEPRMETREEGRGGGHSIWSKIRLRRSPSPSGLARITARQKWRSEGYGFQSCCCLFFRPSHRSCLKIPGFELWILETTKLRSCMK